MLYICRKSYLTITVVAPAVLRGGRVRVFLKVPGWAQWAPPRPRGSRAQRARAVTPHVCWRCPWRPCLCMWFGSGGPAPGLWLVTTKCAVLRCRLFGSIVSFFVPLSHSQTLTALCSPSPRPAWMALLFSAFTEKVETRGLGHRQGQASRQPTSLPVQRGHQAPQIEGRLCFSLPWSSSARFLRFPEFPMQLYYLRVQLTEILC